MAGKDTKTRYQGVYKRHEGSCALSVALVEGHELPASACDCKGAYFGVAYDKQAKRPRKTRHFQKAIEARNARADLQASLRMGRPVGSSAMRFDMATEKFLEAAEDGTALTKRGKQYREGALRDLTSLNHLPERLKSRRLDDLTKGDLQGAIDEWIADGLSASRVRSRIYAVSSLYRWAKQRDFASTDPASEVQLPADDSRPRDRVATPMEFDELLAPISAADQVPLALAAYGSARAAEIRRLEWPDVDLRKRAILLAEIGTGGGKSAAATRIVPVVRPLLTILRAAHLRQGRPKSGKVCPPLRASKSGELATGQYLKRVRKAWDKVNKAERAQARAEHRKPSLLDAIDLHESRHTCATWLDHAGVSPKVASQWMGHSVASEWMKRINLTLEPGAPLTLNTYTHVLAGELERARDQLDAFLTERSATLREVK